MDIQNDSMVSRTEINKNSDSYREEGKNELNQDADILIEDSTNKQEEHMNQHLYFYQYAEERPTFCL